MSEKLIKELADERDQLRAEVERLRAELRWIPVEERLPEPMDYVLVRAGDCVCTAFATPHEWLGAYDPVTHWRPLPPLPGEEVQP